MPRAMFLVAGATALATVLLVGALARAGGTRTFRQTSAKDFEEGEATATLILPSGELAPGLKAGRVPLSQTAFVWCSVLAPDGKTAYFGTGDEGKIFSVDAAAGRGKTETAARQLAKLDAPWVTALAVRADGTLLAGTTPGGRLFAVDPRNGNSRELARVPAEHIWSLVIDPKSGTAYVGAGAPGKIFAVDGAGKVRALWDSGDKHVVSLAMARDGRLLAGTSEEAILFRVGTDGKAEALHDFEAEEVRAILPVGDTLYVAVNDFDRTGAVAAPTGGPVAAKGTKVVVAAAGTPASAGALPRPGQRKSRAGLYRFEPDGRVEQIFATGDGYFTSVVPDNAGGVYVASGSQGKVYRVFPDRSSAQALDLAERQALTLVRGGDGLLVGTGDVGAIYRPQPASGDEATYLSKVLDAEYLARWGQLRWHGTKGLTFETRSGNTAKPDVTWAAWRKLDHAQASADAWSGEIASPSARYVQYRATLVGGAGARLRDVTVYYLAQNQRARLTEITVAEATPTTGAARLHSSVLKLRWKTDNADADELVYRLGFREETETVWRPLGGPEPLTKAEYDWNTDGLPDGTYVVRVVASDERANPRERALDFLLLSPPLLVDNRKPEVLDLRPQYPLLTGRARDAASPLSDIEYALDGGEWKTVAPADGVFDALEESFSIRLPALAPGPHAVTVRAWDSAENVGAAGVTVTVK